MSGMSAFDELQFEHERTLFFLYGARSARTGAASRPYFKLANSLGEAIADLEANPGIMDEGPFLVRDAFVQLDDDGAPVVHVELVPMQRIVEES